MKFIGHDGMRDEIAFKVIKSYRHNGDSFVLRGAWFYKFLVREEIRAPQD